ncbi:MAG TPA: hypothetical protein VIX37_07320 [Candidatus Sulfotelmatobacter sp.]
MKFGIPIRRPLALVLASSLAFAGAGASDKKDKQKPAANQTIDSGSFGIFIKGQRVATETFHIEQQNGASIIKSQLKDTSGSDSSQKSDLELSSSGELLRYEWSQSSGGSLTVAPDNEFLKERISTPTSSKPAEQAFLLPAVTPILDNNFFIHREVLAWKYLNAVCQPAGGDTKCRQEPADFGTLVPQDRTSMSVRMSLGGKEKVTIRGVDRDLLRLNLHGDQFDWALWVDDHDHFKLMKVAISADNTEVVRD